MPRLASVLKMRGARRWMALLLGFVALASACTPAPQPIQLGLEECAHCRMIISEARFASQALTKTGKAFSFDAIECMAEWVATDGQEQELHSLWVRDSADPERWIPADEATFLRSDVTRSPMGSGLSAWSTADAALEQLDAVGGDLLRWAEVVRIVESEGAHAAHGAEEHDHAAHAH